MCALGAPVVASPLRRRSSRSSVTVRAAAKKGPPVINNRGFVETDNSGRCVTCAQRPHLVLCRGSLRFAQHAVVTHSRTHRLVSPSRGNIFAVEPRKVYLSSPTRDAAAKEGLGGPTGQVVAAGLVAIVAVAAINISKSQSFDGETLSY